jgi:ariadne-1
LLSTTCPLLGCNYIVTSNIFSKCFKDDSNSLRIYNKCLIRNFTDSNSDIKLCPNPKCDIIIELPGHGMVEIKCQCGYFFCFNCLRESHRPCDCEMVEIWEEKSKDEGENAKWLIVNTKQCPSCHKFIEKNQGCNHMTCRKNAGGCGYEFCWICLGEWKTHGGSYYKCEKYNPTEFEKQKEKMKGEVKLEIERYANYFESYNEESKNLKLAHKLLDKIENYKLNLEKNKNQPYLELLFLNEALDVVIDCHRILKSTYIYGYFMKANTNKLYIHHQEMLRKEADLLHELLELDELPKILEIDQIDDFNKEFSKYKGKVRSLITAISKFRENLLTNIKNKPDYIDYDLLKNSQIKKK